MFVRHVSDLLAAYLDARLDAAGTERVRTHLAQCERCRGELEQIEFAARFGRQLPQVQAPPAVWARIEAELNRPPGAPGAVLRWQLAFALLLVCLLAAGGRMWYSERQARPRWEVTRLAGVPTVGWSRLAGSGRIAEGQWLQTDGNSRASLKVGAIGTVEVAPHTRLRLAVARPDEYRLTLAHGEISASVTAPPRLFFVDTSSSTAVDLGCAYTMRVDDDGNGVLRVTFGWVALEWGGKVSEVPAGASCHTRKKFGPGTPYFQDAPASFGTALERFDFADGGWPALEPVLAASRVRDTLTLWHLLSRVAPPQRVRVYDRLVELASLPAGVTREKTLALDPATLKRWGDELVLKW